MRSAASRCFTVGLEFWLQLRLDKRRHMHRLHLGEIHDPVLGAEARELPHRLAVGAAGIGIADVRAEKKSRIRVRASGRAVKIDGRKVLFSRSKMGNNVMK